MFALLRVAFLTNMAIAVGSAQGRTLLKAASTLFDKRLSSVCDQVAQQSCGLDDPLENSCCYESPGVRYTLKKSIGTYTDARFRD